MGEIKNCPFRGHDDVEVRQARVPAHYDYQRKVPVETAYEYRVVCNECTSCGPARPTEEQAIDAWNTRCETSAAL